SVTGAFTAIWRNAAAQSKIRSLGSVVLDTTGNNGKSPPFTCTVLVSIRLGATTSSWAYLGPRGQVLPVTLVTAPSSIVTVISQPKGHMIQFIIRVSTAIFMPPCSTPQSKFLR